MKRTRLALAALLFAIHSGTARGADVPVTLNFNGSGINPQPGTSFAEGTSQGQISPFGAATVTFGDYKGTGSTRTVNVTFTIANGSSFSGTFTAMATVNSPTLSISGNITSGTGIFRNASGSLQFARTITNLAPPTVVAVLKFTVTGSGTVSVADPSSGLTVSPGGLVFTLPVGSQAKSTQGIAVHNGSAEVASLQVATASGTWLSVTPSSGNVPAFGDFPIAVTVNPSLLKAGIYTDQVVIRSSGSTLTVFVELVIGPSGVYLQLSQTGLKFRGNPSGAAPAPQTIVVTNTGVGNLSGLNVIASTTEGGSWLQTRLIPAGEQFQVEVSVNPAGQTVAKHYGRLVFTLPGAPNSPQSVTVLMDLVKDQAQIGFFRPYLGLIMEPAGETTFDTVKIFNTGNITADWRTRIEYISDNGTGWLSISPSSGTLLQGIPTPGVIAPQFANLTFTGTRGMLSPGGYQAVVHLESNPPAYPGFEAILVEMFIQDIVAGGGTVSDFSVGAPSYAYGARAATCNPTQIVSRIVSPPQGIQPVVGEPTELSVFVLSNCNELLSAGSVTASFSNGDPALKLIPVGKGVWSGTWTPHKAAAEVTVSVRSQREGQPILAASKSASWTVVAGTAENPIVNSGGVLSAASGTSPIAPGEFIAIYGANLAAGGGVLVAPPGQPFPTSLGGTQVFLAGKPIPLYFTSAGQIDAIVPVDIPPNTIQQLVVQSGTSVSQPEPVLIGAAEPSVFTQDQSGKGPGAILGQKAGGSAALNTPANPASAGDALLIYCTGLGTTSPSVPAGTPAPSNVLSFADNPASVTVGGKPAEVLFTGLAPGYVGLYQVNVIVPSGIPAGNSVPVVVTVAGASSPSVTVAIR